MEPSDNKIISSQRMSRLSYCSFLCWIGATILGFVSFYLDRYAPYREIRGYPKYKIENYLLLLAVFLSFAGIIVAVSAFVYIRRNRDKLKGSFLAVMGMVLSLITMLVCGFKLCVSLMIEGMATC